MPISLKDIAQFETLNAEAAVFVYVTNSRSQVYPLRVLRVFDAVHKHFLLYLGKRYIFIRSFSRIVAPGKTHEKRYICCKCLKGFTIKKKRNSQKFYVKEQKTQ